MENRSELAQTLLLKRQTKNDTLHLPDLRGSKKEKEEEKMKKVSLALVIGFGLVLMATGAFAVDATQPLTINATVSARATLSLGVGTINFADADPDTVPSIAATENAVSVTAKVRTGSASTATLTHVGPANLVSGSDNIPIGNVTWTATGAGFVPGTMNTVAQSAGSWTGSGNRAGTFSYFLANSWDYATGSYTASTTYTLTAP